MCAICSTHLILLALIAPIYLVKSTNYKAPHYAIFITVLLLFCLVLCSQIPSMYEIMGTQGSEG
jgi:hypothetical protein